VSLFNTILLSIFGTILAIILGTLVTVCMAPPENLTTFLSALFTLAIFEGAYITCFGYFHTRTLFQDQ
jgi:ABC-type Fe3+ transport system permease subunit